MKNIKLKSLVISCLIILLFCSCSPTINVQVDSKENVSLEFSSALGDTVIETLYSLTGVDSATSLFDEKAVSENFKNAGLPLDSVKTEKDNLTAKTKFVSIEEMSKSLPDIIDYSNEKYLIVTFSPEKLQSFVEILPEETVGYIDLLCAPIFTFEELSTEEYGEVLSAIYGKKVAEETLGSNFVINFSVLNNYKITNLQVSIPNAQKTISGNKAKITIPLADFLCNLEESQIRIDF